MFLKVLDKSEWIMRFKNRPWAQFAGVVALGTAAGLMYRYYRSSETEWSSTHYRLDQTVGFPVSRGIPFGEQFILDARGERISVPLNDGQEISFGEATWWNVDESGRMRTWNEERVEVFPVLTAR